jgi:hypothetical protein
MFSVSFPDKSSVLLTPKEQALAGMISKIELKLADRKGLLDEVIIFEGPDSYTKMIFKTGSLTRKYLSLYLPTNEIIHLLPPVYTAFYSCLCRGPSAATAGDDSCRKRTG